MSSLNYRRCCQVTLACLLLALPILAPAAMRTNAKNTNSPLNWMPLTFAARGDYEVFRQCFENGDLVIVAWPGCTIDDPRLAELTDALASSPDAVDSEGNSYFDRMMDGFHVSAQLHGEPLKLPRAEIARRLQGSLVGPDQKSSCAVIVFTLAGLAERGSAVELIQSTLEQKCGVPRADQHLAGPIVDGLSVDLASKESQRFYGPPSGIMILLLGWWCLRSFRVALLVFFVAWYCVVATLALVEFCGDTLNALLIVMSPLVLVLGMSGGIHLVNYLYDARQHGGREGLAKRAVALGWVPCFLSAGTTAIGMGSLLVSDVVPVRQFGMYAAFGVSLTFILLFLVIPGAFEIWPSLAESRRHSGHGTSEVSEPRHSLWDHLTLRSVVKRAPNLVAIVSTLMMLVAGVGVPWITTSVHIQTLFASHTRILSDYAWIEQHLGPMVPIEIVLRFDADCKLSTLARMELVTAIEERLHEMPPVKATMSAMTFGPRVPPVDGSAKAQIARTVINRRVALHLDEFAKLHYLYIDGQQESWRISARVSALGDLDYGQFVHDVRETVEPMLDERRAAGVEGLSAVYTGVMPLVHEVQRALLEDLFTSFLTAFATITLVMMIVEGGIMAGLASMVSNIFPMILLFGLLGWIGRPMDIGSVMTASVALGMAIDGTLHFLTFYRRGLQHHSSTTAVLMAYQQCAGAMTQSTVVCGLGVLVFVMSSFLPASRFASMMIWLMLAALVGDLVVLPALLLGPCGRWFRPLRTETAELPLPEINATAN